MSKIYLKTFEEMKRTSAFFMLKPVNAIYGFIVTICVSIRYRGDGFKASALKFVDMFCFLIVAGFTSLAAEASFGP